MTETFIYQQKINPELCNAIVAKFKNNPTNWEGAIASIKLGKIIDKQVKNSKDNLLETTPDLCDWYIKELQKVVEGYIEKYPWCDKYAAWKIAEGVNVQLYPPGGGFFSWHTERGSCVPPFSGRHLVFMTYLNDVTDGGETEFLHQGLKVQPQKGLTLIWPADWTHTHRGVASPTQEKAIVTGWFNYV